MKAVRFQEPEGFEGIEALVYEDAPDPQPAIGDALVQVRAASFTPTELTWPLGTDRAGHDRGPRIPAHEGSGIVAALGYGAAGVSVGDEVYGLIDGLRDGWAAEYVTIEARSLAPKPTTVDFVEAAAIPQAGLTSWQALFDHGRVSTQCVAPEPDHLLAQWNVHIVVMALEGFDVCRCVLPENDEPNHMPPVLETGTPEKLSSRSTTAHFDGL